MKPCRVDSKPWLAIRTSAIAALDGSHELVPLEPPELKEPQRDGLLCPERRSGRASTRADQSARSGPKPALLAHTAHTTSKKTTERPDTTISKVPRRCFRALGPTGAWTGCTRYLRPHAAHTATVGFLSAGRRIRPSRGHARFGGLVGGTVRPQKGRSRHERVLDVRSKLLRSTGERRHIDVRRMTRW